MKSREPLWFFLLSLFVLLLSAVALWQTSHPSWKTYQREFHALEAQHEPNLDAKQAVLDTPLEVSQIMLPGLQRVDRCTTCHLGVEDPTLKDAPQPFAYHPDLERHPPSSFGCTVCHGGQGLATDKDSAHGFVKSWPQPLLSKQYIGASCGKCHKEGDVPGVPELTEGRKLFNTYGCRGCHKLNGVGGTVGPDLSEEGSKERDPAWLEAHFLDPKKVSPATPMPNFKFTAEQARSLTSYMLSLTSETMGAYYLKESVIPGVAYGRELFVQKNCISCHAIGGVGGGLGPDLAGVGKRHSMAWLDLQLSNPQWMNPGSAMPAYDLPANDRTAVLRFVSAASAADATAIEGGLARPPSAEAAVVESGKQAFVRYGCVGCHGQDASGGVPNPNAQGGQVPALIHVAEDYKKPEVAKIIQNGKTAPIEDPNKPPPPLYMPSWKAVLSEEDVANIVEYLWSLKPKEAEDKW
jgi:mono/diheme cytochrome c family protein